MSQEVGGCLMYVLYLRLGKARLLLPELRASMSERGTILKLIDDHLRHYPRAVEKDLLRSILPSIVVSPGVRHMK